MEAEEIPATFESDFPAEAGFLARYYKGQVRLPLGGHIKFEVALGDCHGGPKPGRNDPCDCGSGSKYKKCCGKLTRS